MNERILQALNTLTRMEAEGADNDLLIPYLLITGYRWALQDANVAVPTDDEVALLITVISELLVDWTQENPDGALSPATEELT